MERQKNKFAGRFWALLLLSCIFIYSVYHFSLQTTYCKNQEKKIGELTQQANSIIAVNDELLDQLEYTRSDEFFEKMARESLGMIREGDIRFIYQHR